MTRLDITGLKGPKTILKVRKSLAVLKSGDALTVLADDRLSVQDVPSFCKNTGHHLVMAKEEKGVVTFQIKKGDL